MIMENKIRYLLENKLIVYPTRGTLQENYFSIEYLLAPMQINSLGDIHDEWISYNIKLIDIFNPSLTGKIIFHKFSRYFV